MSSPLLVIHTYPRQTYVISNYLKKVSDVKNVFLSNLFKEADFFVTCNGRLTQDEEDIAEGQVYQCVPRLLAGKGGFGSMLRAIGAQIEKTTSREACRDLSGRRMRDVNNEKKLKDWLSKQADREREKEEKRQERLARRRACPQHNFDDPQYVAQRSQVAEDLDDALQTALVRDKTGPAATVTSADITRKRRAPSETLMKAKRQRGWLGIDPDDLSSESSDDDKESSSKDGVVAEESSDGLTPKDDTPCSNSKKDGVVTEESSDGHTPKDDTPCSNSKKDGVVTEESSDGLTPKDDTPCSNESTTDVSASAESSPSISSHSRSVEGNKYSIESKVKDGREITAESHTLLSSLPSSVNINKLEDIDLSEFSSASELEVIGMDRLKFALTQRGLKCGGTVEQRAERLFSVKGLTHDQIDPSLFPKTQNVRHKKK